MWERTRNLHLDPSKDVWTPVRRIPPGVLKKHARRLRNQELNRQWGLPAGDVDPIIPARRYYYRLRPCCPACRGKQREGN